MSRSLKIAAEYILLTKHNVVEILICSSQKQMKSFWNLHFEKKAKENKTNYTKRWIVAQAHLPARNQFSQAAILCQGLQQNSALSCTRGVIWIPLHTQPERCKFQGAGWVSAPVPSQGLLLDTGMGEEMSEWMGGRVSEWMVDKRMNEVSVWVNWWMNG